LIASKWSNRIQCRSVKLLEDTASRPGHWNRVRDRFNLCKIFAALSAADDGFFEAVVRQVKGMPMKHLPVRRAYVPTLRLKAYGQEFAIISYKSVCIGSKHCCAVSVCRG
jgi:hypothetical protein